MLTCFIIDDEDHAIQCLTTYIAECADLKLIGAFNSTLAALEMINGGCQPDLIFMDIDIPLLSGIDLAKLLPKEIAIIYVTGLTEQALNSFDTNVCDYLLKPVSFPRFLKAVLKVKSALNHKIESQTNNHEYIFINPGVKGKVVRIQLKDISYIEGLKNYVVINHVKLRQITYLTMHEIERALPATNFIRIHKSFIVNLSKIECVEGNMMTLSDVKQLPIGPSYKPRLLQLIGSRTILSKR